MNSENLGSSPHRDRVRGDEMRAPDDDLNIARLAEIIGIPSPTGEEAKLAAHLCTLMQEDGLEAFVQPIDGSSANVVGTLGDGLGPSVLLFAPIDSAFSGRPEEELPWVGPAMRPDLLPRAIIDGDHVTGLSAENPKGHIVALLGAVRALARARVPLAGRAKIGFAAGGAPSNRRSDPQGRHTVDTAWDASTCCSRAYAPISPSPPSRAMR